MAELKLAIETFQSKRRMAVIKVLGTPKTPTQIKESIKVFYPEMSTNHCSDALRWLEERGIVKCSNPEARKGRLYVLLEKGEELRKAFFESDLVDAF